MANKDTESSYFNAGINYVVELVHNSRMEANWAIQNNDTKTLFRVLIGYHIALKAEMLKRHKKVEDLDQHRSDAQMAVNNGSYSNKGVVMGILERWFEKLSCETHKLGLAMPSSDSGRGAAGRV